jgi:hypothetical protein
MYVYLRGKDHEDSRWLGRTQDHIQCGAVVLNFVCHIEGRTWREGICECGAEENI